MKPMSMLGAQLLPSSHRETVKMREFSLTDQHPAPQKHHQTHSSDYGFLLKGISSCFVFVLF
jgi:hypothetical protein